MKNKKIQISWQFGVPISMQIDFGAFSAHKKNQIMVDAEFWKEYVNARFEYEVRQKELFERINKKTITRII